MLHECRPTRDSTRKRMIFAEEIRKRNRQGILTKMREDFQACEEVDKLIHHLPQSISTLYQFIQQNPHREKTIAIGFAHWLIDNNPQPRIQSKGQCLQWACLLMLTIEFKSDKMQLVLQKMFRFLFEFQQRAKQLNVVFLVATQCIKLCESEDVQKIYPYIDMIMESEYCHAKEYDQNHLSFYLFSFHRSLPFTKDLGESKHFLKSLISILNNRIEKSSIIALTLKILIVITYQDGCFFSKSTQYLLEQNLLSILQFSLEFMNYCKLPNIFNLIFTLLINISENVGSQILIQHNILSQLKSILDSEDANRQILTNAGLCFLIIIKNLNGTNFQRQQLREIDGISLAVRIVNDLVKYQPMIIIEAVGAFDRLLQMGEELKVMEDLQQNPMALKLRYEGFLELCKTFPSELEDLERQYFE